MNNYGATSADGNDFDGCSAACYVGLLAGYTYGVSDGYGSLTASNLVADRMASSGLTWQAYCENGCPRGNDHFPFTSFTNTQNSANVFAESSVSTSTFISAANVASPANLLWFTPTDSHNMHDVSVTTGDSYLKSFLVGSGSIVSPASGSLLASNVFINPSYRTLLYLWWDECGGSNGSCDSNNAAPNLLYGPMVKKGYVSPDSTGIDEYASIWTIENNWGFAPLAQGDTAAKNNGYQFNDIFTSAIPLPLSASFTNNPSIPVSGRTITFTATASGGTSPYSYSWSLGETSKTGNPVSQSFTNGTYTISLTVTDSGGKTATGTQSLIVLPTSTGGSVPVLVGWGGVRMDESVAGSSGISSSVFPGEHASDMELLLIEMKTMGYNSVRVNFDPYCTDTVDYNYMSVYSQTNAQRAVQIAQHYGFWIIIDYHGYSDIFRNTNCWLNYWKPIVQNIGPSYSQIIWEPENEPTLICKNSPSSCPSTPCSGDASCVAYLGSAYQQWIDQARSLGDNHWIVAQNLCSYTCGFNDFSQGYPSVTDPLGTLSHGGRIFISLHSYMDYNQTFTSWTNATAESIADQFYQAVLAGVANTGWPALNTEGGTDPLSCDPNICAPDVVLDGSGGYTVVTFHFIQTLVDLYDSHGPQRVNWLWWPAGSWTNTPAAGVYGALQCSSNPIGWGCLLKTVPVAGTLPILSTSFTFTPNAPAVNQAIAFKASASGGAGPYVFSWNFGDGSTASGSSVTHTYMSAGSFAATLTAKDSGSPQQTTTSPQTIKVNSPPQPLSSSLTFVPSSPRAGRQVTFNATAAGGTWPYSYSWTFGDGSSGIGSSATHTYSAAGSFTVTLIVKDNGSPQQTISSQRSVSISNPPPPLTVIFTSSPSLPEKGQQVTFTASASGGIAPYSFSWSFGEGGSSSANPAMHTYSSSGSFTVTVTAVDASGSRASSSQTVSLAAAPSVNFSFSTTSPEATSPVTFTATTTAGVGPFTFSWNFGDGGSSSSNPAMHTYTGSGSFTVTVTATDANGGVGTFNQTVLVAALLSVSFIHNPPSLTVAQSATFTASTNGGVGTSSFDWSFGDGSSSSADPATHTYNTSGSFEVTVTATDSDGIRVTSSQSVTVNAILTGSFTFSPSSAQVGQSFTFTGTASGGVSPYSYSWNFGDGSTETGLYASHIYSSAGSFTVSLTVMDSGSPGQTASSAQSASVTPPPLTAGFTYAPSSVQVGEQVTFTASWSGGTAPYFFNWAFDDSSATGSIAAHTFSSAGTFNVTLTITDSSSPQQTAISSATITVLPTPTSTMLACPGTGIVGETLTCSATIVDTTTGSISVPSGFVSFTPGGNCTLSGGSCFVSITPTVSSSLYVSASYTGDAQHLASTSATVTISIKNRETSTTVNCGLSTLTIGQTTSCSATVTDTSPGTTSTPSGNVSFTSHGSCILTGTGASAICSITFNPMVAGPLTVAANYPGDSTHNSSSGNTMISLVPPPPQTPTADFVFSPTSPVTGQTIRFTATATDGIPPYSYSWNFGDGSTGSTNPTSHAFDSANTYSAVLVVTDSNGTTFSVTKSLEVMISPTPPIVLTAPSGELVNEGSSLTFNVTAVESSSVQVSLVCDSCSTLGATFTSSGGPGAAFGIFSWTPLEVQAPGSYLVVISSTDGTHIVNATVMITVVEVEAPPTLHVPPTLVVRQGETLQFTVNVTDPDAPVDNITLMAVGLPDGSSFNATTGIFYWPVQDAQPGTYTVTFIASDNETPPLQDNATVRIHVNNGNGRCFICDMLLESMRPQNMDPLPLLLRAMSALIGFLTVMTIKHFAKLSRPTTQ